MTSSSDISHLNTGKMIITFTKVDGELRVMRCTKNINLIPEDKRPKMADNSDAIQEETQSNVVKVFDLDIQEWRSFRLDSLMKAEVAYD